MGGMRPAPAICMTTEYPLQPVLDETGPTMPRVRFLGAVAKLAIETVTIVRVIIANLKIGFIESPLDSKYKSRESALRSITHDVHEKIGGGAQGDGNRVTHCELGVIGPPDIGARKARLAGIGLGRDEARGVGVVQGIHDEVVIGRR